MFNRCDSSVRHQLEDQAAWVLEPQEVQHVNIFALSAVDCNITDRIFTAYTWQAGYAWSYNQIVNMNQLFNADTVLDAEGAARMERVVTQSLEYAGLSAGD